MGAVAQQGLGTAGDKRPQFAARAPSWSLHSTWEDAPTHLYLISQEGSVAYQTKLLPVVYQLRLRLLHRSRTSQQGMGDPNLV